MNAQKENNEQQLYDVAISFLSPDSDTALRIADKLAPLNVFCFPRNQEELAGTDGMESFRQAFRHQSRIQVVLFRAGWGQTPWTGIEQTAIKERCFNEGWRGLFFVALEKAIRPKWVPDSEIHFDLSMYSMDELVGAIKARAQELGAELRKETPIEKARKAKARADFAKETRELFSGHGGVQLAREQSQVICDRLEPEIKAAADELDIKYRLVRPYPFNIAWSTANAGLLTKFNCAVNAVDKDAAFEVQLFKHDIVLPGENLRYHNPGMPKQHCRDRYKVARKYEMGMCWEIHTGTFMSSDTLADKIFEDYWSVYEESVRNPLQLDF